MLHNEFYCSGDIALGLYGGFVYAMLTLVGWTDFKETTAEFHAYPGRSNR